MPYEFEEKYPDWFSKVMNGFEIHEAYDMPDIKAVRYIGCHPLFMESDKVIYYVFHFQENGDMLSEAMLSPVNKNALAVQMPPFNQ